MLKDIDICAGWVSGGRPQTRKALAEIIRELEEVTSDEQKAELFEIKAKLGLNDVTVRLRKTSADRKGF